MINIKNIQFTSVIITSLNDGFFIENLLNDLLNQTIKKNSYEVLILEAGHFKSENQYNKIFSNNKIKFSFYKKEKLSRTASLNFLIDKAVGDFIVRLDARSRIKKNYLNQLIHLSNSTSAACVGGVKLPVGTNALEKIIALTMINPIAFGGGNFRKENFRGYANGIYLGAFKKELVYLDKWYDEINPKISEDTDITRRIIETGEKVFIDSSIVVEYQPRDSYNNFFKMCFNYGVGRGIFIYKHKKVNDFRQIVPPICVCLGLLLIALSFYKIIFLFFLISLITLYLILMLIFSFVYSKHFYDMFKVSYATVGCHLFWILGFFYGPLIAKRYN